MYFRTKVFNDPCNFKIKHLFVSASSSVIYLSICPCQSCTIFPVFNSFCEMQLSSISFGLFNRRTINSLSRKKSDTSVLKYLRLKINALSSKIRRLHQISLPFIARCEKFSDVHPKSTHLEAYKYYLFSALSSEASKFFLVLYRS